MPTLINGNRPYIFVPTHDSDIWINFQNTLWITNCLRELWSIYIQVFQYPPEYSISSNFSSLNLWQLNHYSHIQSFTYSVHSIHKKIVNFLENYMQLLFGQICSNYPGAFGDRQCIPATGQAPAHCINPFLHVVWFEVSTKEHNYLLMHACMCSTR